MRPARTLLAAAAAVLLAAASAAAQSAAPAAGSAPAPSPASSLQLVPLKAAGAAVKFGDGSFGPSFSLGLSYDFQVSRYLVTNGDFAQFVADNGYATRSFWTANGWAWKGARTQPALWKSRAFGADRQPVVGVSWYEAVAFCNWLSAREGLTPAYDDAGRADLSAPGYRLPTELEYVYAAAKGAPDSPERVYPWGDEPQPKNAVTSVPPVSAAATEAVGSRSPQGDTPQGLADMAGNVWEWCSDNFQGDEEISAVTDRYFFSSDSRVERFALHGGSWVISFAGGLHTRFRSFSSAPGAALNSIGFRVVKR